MYCVCQQGCVCTNLQTLVYPHGNLPLPLSVFSILSPHMIMIVSLGVLWEHFNMPVACQHFSKCWFYAVNVKVN